MEMDSNQNCSYLLDVENQIVAYFESHLTEKWTLKQLSERLGYSISHLEKMHKAWTGKGIIESFIEFRMDKACRLLREGELSVKKTASLIGYDNVSYFSRLFKKRYGMSPSEFIKTARTR